MTIETQEDWWNLADKMLPRLHYYAAGFGLGRITENLMILLEKREVWPLHSLFEELWGALPDSESIRTDVFHDLCDLCSEVWVFEDVEGR